ncbi:MAG: nitroreductase family protein [Coriobacteriia bacterium]|nr:nitroreductase family protein [Coriobacteriia bacterium]
MDNKYYNTIFKRKSFHLFRNLGDEKLTREELDNIRTVYNNFEPLYPDIKTEIKIIPSTKKGAEYQIEIYSEKADNYLMNAGYIGEQLDLYLQHNSIASLWCGIDKPDEQTHHGLDYVIMFHIKKVSNKTKYRIDMFKARRKDLKDIWRGDDLGVANIARFAPSAVNSQPWYVENIDNKLVVYRYKKPGRIGIMTTKAARYFNRIDIGIYLCILEICLNNEDIKFQRQLFIDAGTDQKLTKVAEYKL